MKRLEAAFLLLKICPKCGSNCSVQGLVLWCPIHQIIYTGTIVALWNALDPPKGAYEENSKYEQV